MPYPPSSFEAGVAGFLQGLTTVQGIKANRQEARIRQQQADRADQESQVRLDEAGYDRITMPKIESPPNQSFAQSVGSYLSNHFGGGSDQPSSIVMKTHPSARDEDRANEQAFTLSRDAAHAQTERDIEQMKAALAVKLERDRQVSEDKRSAANNRTSITVAGIDHTVQAAALEDRQRTEFFDNAVAASGGNADKAMQNVKAYQYPQAQRFKATRADYYAAVARRNAPAEELKKARAELDLQRAGQLANEGRFMSPNGPGAPPPPPGVAPVARQPLAASDKAAAKKDPAFAAHLKSLGYVKGRDY